jgi:hypothetical protein
MGNTILDEEYLNKRIKKIKTVTIILLIIFLIIFILYLNSESTFDRCVEKVGHSECGLGSLCDSECMPPFYFTLSILGPMSSFIAIIVLIVGFFQYYKIKKLIDIVKLKNLEINK